MINKTLSIKKLKFVLLFLLLSVLPVACGEGDTYYLNGLDYQEKNGYEDIVGQGPRPGEIMAERVKNYLLEDLDYLEARVRANAAALAGPVYRRTRTDIWQQFETLREDIHANAFRFGGRGILEESMEFATSWFEGEINQMGVRQRGLLHFGEWWSFFDGARSASNFPQNIGHRGNIAINILEQDKIAYIRVRHAFASIQEDRDALMPFLREIQNYEHLIIDIRTHGGGFVCHFMEVILKPLIGEPLHFSYSQFFTSGGHFTSMIENAWPLHVLIQPTAYSFHHNIYSAAEFVEKHNMIYFNQEDLGHLAYAVELHRTYKPAEDGYPFNGKIWLLIDGSTASAGEHAVITTMSSGFATVVGSPTLGVMPSESTSIFLPNTRLRIRLDIGYFTDAYGRSLTEFGISPHYRNRPGMDALQTVLAMIEEGAH